MIRYGSEAKIMSAFSVVTPAATARSEYRSPSPMSISVSDLTMCVDDRCTIVTSAPASHSAPQMSNAELFEPITTARLPAYASGPGCCDEWCWSPRKTSCPGRFGMFGLPDMPVASTSCLGAARPLAVPLDRRRVHSPAASS